MEEENINLILEQAKDKSDKIFDVFNKYDTKSTILLAVIGLVFAIIPSDKISVYINIAINNRYTIDIPLDLRFFGYIFLLFGIIFIFLSFKIVKVHFPPDVRMLRGRYLNEKALFTKRRLLSIFINAIEKNTSVIYLKARYFSYGFIFTLLALIYFLIIKLFI